MDFIYFLGTPLGYVMEIIYNVVLNYGWAIILFTLTIRLATLPLAVIQQKSTAKMSAFQPLMTEIQQKYKNDKDKQTEELTKIQTEFGYNPLAGCLPMFLNFFIMFGVIEVMYRPLQRIFHFSSEKFEQAEVILTELGVQFTIVNRDTNIVQQILSGNQDIISIFSEQELASINAFANNMNFFGIDLLQVPQLSLAAENLPLLIFPILSVITMFASTIISMRASGQSSQLKGSMKVMMYAMPLLFVSFCFTVPCAFSLYYTVSNLIMMIQSMVMRKFYDPAKMKVEFEKVIAEKRKEQRQGVKTTVVKVVDEKTGTTKEEKLTATELNRRRLELARKLDEEKYGE